AQMDHPAIVPIHDFGQHEGWLFFVMPWVQGTLLLTLIREGTLVLGETLDIGAQIAEALDYSHSRGVVHRDVKPGNIIVSREQGDPPFAGLRSDNGPEPAPRQLLRSTCGQRKTSGPSRAGRRRPGGRRGDRAPDPAAGRGRLLGRHLPPLPPPGGDPDRGRRDRAGRRRAARGHPVAWWPGRELAPTDGPCYPLLMASNGGNAAGWTRQGGHDVAFASERTPSPESAAAGVPPGPGVSVTGPRGPSSGLGAVACRT
ncbi:MAG: protein kinase, partial [bacterium]|nr:protein kinase [bacterium]